MIRPKYEKQPRRSKSPAGFSDEVKALVLARDGGRCVLNSRLCLGEASTVDHRVGRGMGGSRRLNVPHNGVAVCGPCNGLRESDATFQASLVARGIKVLSSHDAAKDGRRCLTTPVLYPDGQAWWLTPWGSRVQVSTEVPF